MSKWKKPHPGHNKLTKWNWVVAYPEGLKIGKMVDIGAFTYIQAQEGVEIGDYVQIGSHCSIYSANTINNRYGKVKIMKHVVIGSHSVILPNVVIGEGAKIGAFSLITRDVMGMQTVPPFTKW